MNRSSSRCFGLIATALLVACGDPIHDDSGLTPEGEGIDPSIFDDQDKDDEGLDGGDHGDNGDDGLGAADDGGGPECTSERFDLAAEPPSVMLVLDKSSSMSDERWLDQGEPVTRWHSLHGVVSDLVTTYDSTIDFGATLFPAAGSGRYDQGFAAACGVAEAPDVPTGPEASAAILDAIPGPDVAVQGATPASAGMMTALQHLALAQEGPRAVLLVTDGLANCAHQGGSEMFLYDEGLPVVVQAAYEELGIPTYVVGIDIRDEYVGYANANAHEELDRVARVGGVPREGDTAYYAADDVEALDQAMDQIAARIECTVPLDAPVPEEADFEVTVDDTPVPEVSDCSAEDGWRFTDPAQRSTIELCGQACDALRVHGQMELRICEEGTIPAVP